MLPGFQRPRTNRRRRSVEDEEHRALRAVSRRRITPRTAHIMHESTLLENLAANDAASLSVADEARMQIEALVTKKMQWKAPRKASFQFWVSRLLVNNILNNYFAAFF